MGFLAATTTIICLCAMAVAFMFISTGIEHLKNQYKTIGITLLTIGIQCLLIGMIAGWMSVGCIYIFFRGGVV